MILIAESGSTKCHWVLCDLQGKVIKEVSTIGFNPNFTDQKSILNHLKKSKLSNFSLKVKHVYFYGAGCSNDDINKILKLSLCDFFKNSKIFIRHDLEAACYAAYQKNSNITCILGTGSNSCMFDGKKIIKKSPSLGFILGDEASGNYFGKKILNTYFNKLLPKELEIKLEKGYETDIKNILNKVYNNRRANVFLAGFFPFIYDNKSHPYIKKIVHESLNKFINLHIKCFDNYLNLEINFIGSVAYFLNTEICEICEKNNLSIGRIIKNPINKLVDYHFQNEQLRFEI